MLNLTQTVSRPIKAMSCSMDFVTDSIEYLSANNVTTSSLGSAQKVLTFRLGHIANLVRVSHCLHVIHGTNILLIGTDLLYSLGLLNEDGVFIILNQEHSVILQDDAKFDHLIPITTADELCTGQIPADFLSKLAESDCEITLDDPDKQTPHHPAEGLSQGSASLVPPLEAYIPSGLIESQSLPSPSGLVQLGRQPSVPAESPSQEHPQLEVLPSLDAPSSPMEGGEHEDPSLPLPILPFPKDSGLIEILNKLADPFTLPEESSSSVPPPAEKPSSVPPKDPEAVKRNLPPAFSRPSSLDSNLQDYGFQESPRSPVLSTDFLVSSLVAAPLRSVPDLKPSSLPKVRPIGSPDKPIPNNEDYLPFMREFAIWSREVNGSAPFHHSLTHSLSNPQLDVDIPRAFLKGVNPAGILQFLQPGLINVWKTSGYLNPTRWTERDLWYLVVLHSQYPDPSYAEQQLKARTWTGRSKTVPPVGTTTSVVSSMCYPV
ncbi:hypothetical protein RCL1_008276 [Eukaryota sp. TZLM3-RCL]